VGIPNQFQAPILELGGVETLDLGDLPAATLDIGVNTARKLYCVNNGGTINLPVPPPPEGSGGDQDTFVGDYVIVINASGEDVDVFTQILTNTIASGDMSAFFLGSDVIWRQAWSFPRFGGGGSGGTIEVQANGSPVSGSPFSILNFLGPDVVAANNGGGNVGIQPDRFPLGGTLFYDFTTEPSPLILVFTTSRRRVYVTAGSGAIRLPTAVNGDTYEVIVDTAAGPVDVQRSNGSTITTVLADQVWMGAAPVSGLTTWTTLKRYDRFAT
jgi:hypothetical protein